MKKPELYDAINKAGGRSFDVSYNEDLVKDEESYIKHTRWGVGLDHNLTVIHGEPEDKPKWEDVKKAMDELEAEYASFEFQRKRKPEYPSLEECVHAILDDNLEELQAKRKAVKDKYPKSELKDGN